ncbi:MAG TPA: hypothetical protein VME43_28720 [Bryobacteraceae bacterium]|nr:hypothetical protein [Bryobacteraceae bacterium]
MSQPLRSLSIPFAAGLLPLLLGSAVRQAPLYQGGPEPMLSYEAIPDKTDYLPGERIGLKLRIANSGPEAVELPDPQHPAADQPTIALIGPAFPQGRMFNNLMALREASGNPLLAPPPPPRVRIEPGATWEGFAPITPVVQVPDPGEYRIRTLLAYQGAQATSKEARFQVHPMAPSSVHLGLGVRPFEAATGEVVFIQHGEHSAGVYSLRFDETRPDISEMDTEKPIHRATAGADATDVAAPWRNAPYFNELLQWIVWREGRSIKALSSVMSQPLSLDLPMAPAYLVQPPLKTTGGPVEVLAVSHDRREISLVEFSSGPAGQDPAARVAWTERLPAEPAAITATLAPVSRGSTRHVAFTVQHPWGFEIFHSRYTEAGRLEPFQSVRVEKARLLGDAPPALFAGDSGPSMVGVLAVPDNRTHACTLVEAEFDDSGKPVGPLGLTAFTLEARPTAGAVLYSQNGAGPVRLDVVIAAEGEGLLHMNRGHLVPVSVQGTPTRPILLAPGAQSTFVLYSDPKRGLYFEAL